MRDEDGDGLTARALSGDRGAWDRLIGKYDRRVYLAVFARGLPPSRAREIVQETWLDLFDKARRGRLERLSLPGLAIRHARWRATDAHRRRRHMERPVDEPDDWTPPGIKGHTKGHILARDRLRRLVRRLDDLPEHRHTIFMLFYWEQLSAPEIAERLGLSVQRVRQSLCETREMVLDAGEAA